MDLLSISQLTAAAYLVAFTNTRCFVQGPSFQKQIGTGRRSGRLYYVKQLHLPTSLPLATSTFRASPSEFYLWHSRLGHLSFMRLKHLIRTGVLGHVTIEHFLDCIGCKISKHTALPFNVSSSATAAPFDLIHSDIWGPASQSTKGGSFYYVLFINDCTRYTWLNLMKTKSDFFNIYVSFATMITI